VLYSTDVSSELNVTITRYNLDLSLFYKYNGKLADYNLNEEGEIEYGYMESYHTMDFSFVKRMKQNRISLSGGVKNLFNNYNVSSFGVSGEAHADNGSSSVSWGRTWFVKCSMNIHKSN